MSAGAERGAGTFKQSGLHAEGRLHRPAPILLLILTVGSAAGGCRNVRINEPLSPENVIYHENCAHFVGGFRFFMDKKRHRMLQVHCVIDLTSSFSRALTVQCCIQVHAATLTLAVKGAIQFSIPPDH